MVGGQWGEIQQSKAALLPRSCGSAIPGSLISPGISASSRQTGDERVGVTWEECMGQAWKWLHLTAFPLPELSHMAHTQLPEKLENVVPLYSW